MNLSICMICMCMLCMCTGVNNEHMNICSYIEMFGYNMPVTMYTKMNVYAYSSHIPKSYR